MDRRILFLFLLVSGIQSNMERVVNCVIQSCSGVAEAGIVSKDKEPCRADLGYGSENQPYHRGEFLNAIDPLDQYAAEPAPDGKEWRYIIRRTPVPGKHNPLFTSSFIGSGITYPRPPVKEPLQIIRI